TWQCLEECEDVGQPWAILCVVPVGAVAPYPRLGLSRACSWREYRRQVCCWTRRAEIRYDRNEPEGQLSDAQLRRGIGRKRPRPRTLRQIRLRPFSLGLDW